MKIIKGGKSLSPDDGFEEDKKYAQILKNTVDKVFGQDLFGADIEFVYDIAKLCWNFNIIDSATNNNLEFDLKSVLKGFGVNKNDVKKYLSLASEFATHTKQMDRLVGDVDIEDFGRGNYHIVVRTQSQADFINEAELSVYEDEDDLGEIVEDEIEFYPNFISRSMLVIRPTKNFVDATKPYSLLKTSVLHTPQAILIEEILTSKGFQNIFQSIKEELFSYILHAYQIDYGYNVPKFSFKLFKEWFEYEVFQDVFDSKYGPVTKR